MVSMSFSSLCLSPNPNPLLFLSKVLPSQIFAHSRTNYEFRKVRVPAAKKAFPTLQADDFRHPLDLLEKTRWYRAFPDLVSAEEPARDFFVEDKIENDDTSILAGPTQHSNTYELMAETAKVLNMATPLLYIRSSDAVPLARAVELDTPCVVIHSSLIDLLTPEELQVVFAHELAHLKCGHYLLLKVLNLFLRDANIIPEWLITRSLMKKICEWVQAAVFSCDRASLLVSQDPKVVTSAIMKLNAGYPSSIKEVDVDAFLAEARAHVGDPSYRDDHETLLSYPLPAVRVYEIDQWARSEEYAVLVASATTLGEKENISNHEEALTTEIVEALLEKVDVEMIVVKLLEKVDVDIIVEKLFEKVKKK